MSAAKKLSGVVLIAVLALAHVPAFGKQPKPARPIGKTERWISINDYPAAAWIDNQQGSTRYVLSIDTEGRVADCTIFSSSGNADLDARTCSVLRERGRFRPARDEEGNATTGSFAGRVNWRRM